jgi:hypothetical protein
MPAKAKTNAKKYFIIKSESGKCRCKYLVKIVKMIIK